MVRLLDPLAAPKQATVLQTPRWRAAALFVVLALSWVRLLGASPTQTPSPTASATPNSPPPVNMQGADGFSVLAGAGISNTGLSRATGYVGSSPLPTETGFGSLTLYCIDHGGDAVTAAGKTGLTAAYLDASTRSPAATVPTELGATTLAPGVYAAASGTFGLTGVLSLDGGGNTSAVFIFQTTSTLITASGSSVLLINGAQARNVFWAVGSSATLGTATAFVGTLMALTSITLNTSATVEGRVLAINGAVTLDTGDIDTVSSALVPCSSNGSATVTLTATATWTPTPTLTQTSSVTETGTPTSTVTRTATATISVTFSSSATQSSTASGTRTLSPTASKTPTPPATASPSRTLTQNVSASATATRTISPTASASSTATRTSSPTASASATATRTPNLTASASPTKTLTSTVTRSFTVTSTNTVIPTYTQTPALTAAATTTPQAPVLSGAVQTGTGLFVFTGTGLPGSSVFIVEQASNNTLGSGPVAPNGTFAISASATITSADSVEAHAGSPAGPVSGPQAAYVAPAGAAAVGTNSLDAGATVLTASGIPGQSVVVVDTVSGEVLGQGTLGANGLGAIFLSQGTVASHPLKLVVGGKIDSTVTVGATTGQPATLDPGFVAMEGGPVTGHGTPGAQVQLVEASGAVLGSTIVGPDGGFTMTVSGAHAGTSLKLLQNGVGRDLALRPQKLGAERVFLSQNVFRLGSGPPLGIGFKAAADERVVVKIFNIAGELVRPVADMDVKTGVAYALSWDGHNSDGEVAAGVYIVSAKGPQTHILKKVVLLK